MRKKLDTRNMALFAMFLAIELLLVLTPLGYIRTPALSITLMHIPVVVCGILMGPGWGAALGLVFGLTSVWNATMQPNLTSFVFSPFITVGGISGNWTSLIIALVPRILLGYLAGIFYQLLSKKLNRPLSALIAAMGATLLHTLMVLGLIALFWGAQYAEAIDVAVTALLAYLGMVIVTNGILEMIAAGVISMALAKAVKPLRTTKSGYSNKAAGSKAV